MKRYKAKTLIKLNLGCGLVAPSGWVNIDNSLNARLAKCPIVRKLLGNLRILPKRLTEIPWPKNIAVLDVRRGLPYPDKSVKHIYISHLLEHLSRADARYLLKECYRTLAPEGVLRVIVPDLLVSAKKYIKDFYKWEQNSEQLPPSEKFLENLLIYDSNLSNHPLWMTLLKIYDKNTHKWAYDEQSLAYFMRTAGFKNICKRKYRESKIDDITQLDRPERFDATICLESVK